MNPTVHQDFLSVQKMVYEPSGLIVENLVIEEENQDYGACSFEMNKRRILFRVGKITPTKHGLFVTLWKRIGKGPIMPYDVVDSIDFFVVSVRNDACFGQFIFPKAVLAVKDIVSKNGIGGKRAIRVYPPWSIVDVDNR